jgi:hypothetical protein
VLNDEEHAFSNELSTELDLYTTIRRVESTDGVPVPHYGDPIPSPKQLHQLRLMNDASNHLSE